MFEALRKVILAIALVIPSGCSWGCADHEAVEYSIPTVSKEIHFEEPNNAYKWILATLTQEDP